MQEIFGVNHHMRDMCRPLRRRRVTRWCAPALFDRAETGVELGYTPDDIGKGRDSA